MNSELLYNTRMGWNINLTPAKKERFMFDGHTSISPLVKSNFNTQELIELMLIIRHEAKKRNGLDKIQRAINIINQQVVLVIHDISEEEKEALKKAYKITNKDLIEFNHQSVVFPEENWLKE